jgi:hypothetical protein
MDHYGFHHRGLVLVVLLAFVFFAVQAPVHAQTKQVLKVVLIDSAVKGFSKAQSELFFTTLQKKVSQFEMLSVSLKSDLMKELSPADKTALAGCSTLSCLQQVSSKIGIERIILCTATLQGNVYHFESSEYGVKSSLKLSDVNEDATCSSSAEINDYIARIAVAVGQKTTRSDYVPDSLKTTTISWWWYAGGAAVVGLGTGILLLSKKSKEGTAVEQTLPGAPDLP